MPPLRELQLSMVCALLDATDPGLSTAWICPGGIEPAERLGIYRNNVRATFIKALALGFPVIEKLVGVDCFRSLALGLLAQHPSRSGDLHHVGEPFPAFLQARFSHTPYSYLPDVAALEWACQVAMRAADCAPLKADELRAVAPAAYAGMRLSLHPRCRVLASAFPIIEIWIANQLGRDPERKIDLGSGPDFVLLQVRGGCALLRRLAQPDFCLLQTLTADGTLGEALDAALAIEADFDLGAALGRYFTLGLFSGVS